MIVIVMGVSGCGKTTVGRALAARLGCEFLDGDDYHPEGNVEKMAAGTPLEDVDRWPWLERLNALMRECAARGESAVLACSALKEIYRERLRANLPDCRFVHLRGPIELIRERLQARSHRYMPVSLLASQYATLEPPREAIEINIAMDLDTCLFSIERALR